MRYLTILALFAVSAFAQCSHSYTITAQGPTNFLNNSTENCTNWYITYTSTGTSGIIIYLEGASSTQAFGPYPGTSPSSLLSGTIQGTGTQNYIRVNIPYLAGSNPSVNVTLIGYNLAGVNPHVQLINFIAALGSKAKNGTSDTKILVVGDSTSFGVGGTNYVANGATTVSSWPNQLAKMINSTLLPTSSGMAVPIAGALTDTQLTYGAGWANDCSANDPGYGGCAFKGTAAGNLVFTPAGGYSYDSFDIYYAKGYGTASATATATGGSGGTITGTTGTQSIQLLTVTAASAATTNAVTIAWGSGTVYILAIEGRKSTQATLRIANAGIYGTSAAAGVLTGTFLNSAAMIQNYAADLCIFMLGINDSFVPAYTASFAGNMLQLANACVAGGGTPLIASFFPSGDNNYYPNEVNLMVPQLINMANLNNWAYAPLFERFGSKYQSSLAYNTLHPNQAGYFNIATFLLPYITQ